MLNTNKSPPEGRKGILVTTSFDLNKAKISVVAIGNSLCIFRLVLLALLVPFFLSVDWIFIY